MKPILFAMPGNEALALGLARALPCETGTIEMHRFPDGEACPRLHVGRGARWHGPLALG